MSDESKLRDRARPPEDRFGPAGTARRRKGRPMTNRSFLALSLGVGAMILATGHAFAQGSRNCAERARVIERLAEGYGETRQSIGLGANNSVIEVFASLETGTWTITVTAPSGITCLVASGQAFENLAEELRPAGEKGA